MLRHAQAALEIVGPQRPGQAVDRVVRNGDRFLLGVEWQHHGHRAKDLFVDDAHARPRLVEHGGAQEEAGASRRSPPQTRRAPSLSDLDVRLGGLALFRRHHRSHLRRVIEWFADHQLVVAATKASTKRSWIDARR